MKHFSEMPEAVDYIASQAWLSPDEPAARIIPYSPHRPNAGDIGPLQAMREIMGVLKRARFRPHSLH